MDRDHQAQQSSSHHRLHQRRKRRPLTSYTPPSSSIIDTSSSSSSNYSNDKTNRNFNDEFRNRFMAKVFISFAIVWTFFTFFQSSQQEPPLKTNIIGRGSSTTTTITSNSDIQKDATYAPLKMNVTEEAPLSLHGNLNRKKKHGGKNEQDVVDQTIPSDMNNRNNDLGDQQKHITAPPKTAFVLVATKHLKDPIKSMSNAIESIIKNTLLERILVIVPIFSHSILERHGIQPEEVKQYFEVDLVQHHYGEQSTTIGDVEGDMSKVKVMIEVDDDDDGNLNGAGNGNNSTTTKKSSTYGVGRSRRNAAQFIQLYHEEQINATKSILAQKNIREQQQQPNEEVILTFLRPDSQIEDSDWLDIATDALVGTISSQIIIPSSESSSLSKQIIPPTLNPDQQKEQESYHNQNAVSFALSQQTKQQQHMNDRKNKRHPQHFHHYFSLQYLLNPNSKKKHTTTSLDINLMPVHTSTPLDYDVKLTKGKAYPTPILEGSATSLLLSTYLGLNANLNLPLSDKYMTSTVAADIELSLNLWLCGSGIDVLTDLHVEKDVVLLQDERDFITNEEKVWLAREWMMDKDSNRNGLLSSTVSGNDSSQILSAANFTTMSIGDKILMRLKHNGTFNNTNYDQILYDMIQHPNFNTKKPHQLEKCRSFDWYAKEVNLVMGRQLQILDKIIAEEVEKSNISNKKKQ